jgi:NADPH-dependent 2,4-dienoyl-CoA reductase/sulfur reductase-like enzyme
LVIFIYQLVFAAKAVCYYDLILRLVQDLKMEKKQVVVVGGGVAGCSSAIEAAKLGMNVLLVDEHPQSLASMSLDAPYFYGSGLPNILNNRNLMSESVLGSNDLLMECLEFGVDVLTNTCVWGSYRPGPNSKQWQVGQVGLADENHSWMVEYEHLILAPGARDLIIPFANWNLPGVFGACAGSALLERYKVFGGESVVVLGSGNIGLRTALAAVRFGIKVVAIIEVGNEILGDALLAAELRSTEVPFYLSHTVIKAHGKLSVTGIQIVEVDANASPIKGSEKELSCEGICLAMGAVPNVELAAVTGCEIIFDAALGGWVPSINSRMQTSENSVYVVGDGAMVTESMHIDPNLAMEQGRLAARAIATTIGAFPVPEISTAIIGRSNYPPTAWHRSLVSIGGIDVMVCQCEEVSRREIFDVSPPNYLAATNRKPNGGLAGLTESGRSSQDQIKRLTRAGMGHCQGKRCRDHTAMLLADASACSLSSIVPGSYRTPVRPLPLKVLWPEEETDETRREWRTWIHAADGIPEV